MRNSRDLLLLFLCAAALLPSCGGGSSSPPPPPPTITSVTVSPATTTVATGKTATFTANVSGTGNYSSAVTWTASGGAAISSSGVLTAPATTGTVTITATSTGDSTKSGAATATIVYPLAVSVAATPSTVSAGNATGAALAATVTGGAGNATVTWSAPSIGAISPPTGLTATYSPPATVTASTAVTITATATDSTGSATATASVTVQRVIAISRDPSINLPNNEIYSDYGTLVPIVVNCSGCQSGDTLNVLPQAGPILTVPYQSVPWQILLNSIGRTYVPGPIKMWVTGTDGVTSNALRFTFDGGSMVGFQDPSTGESYYYYGGDAISAPGTVFSFKPDGTPDITNPVFIGSSPAFTFDPGTGYVFLTDSGRTDVNGINNPSVAAYSIPIGEVAAYDTSGGLVCAVQPQTDTTYCFMATQAAIQQSDRVIATIHFPQGSQPAAVKVLDASHAVVFTRGDSKLSWFTISGAAATPAGALALSQFTNADAAYWHAYPFTGGGNIVAVGSALGVMGRVVNGNGTVSEMLALVNNAAQTVSRYVALPDGTLFLAADPTNGAIVAEYPDYSGATPVTAFTRIYVDTGNSVLLHSTSVLLPGAAFFVTRDGSKIAIFVQGRSDFQPNQ